MAFKSRALMASLPLLWNGVASFPAGPGHFPIAAHAVASPNTTVSAAAAYGLTETYDASNWLGKFDVQAIPDPTHGFVNYVDQARATQLGLIRTQSNAVYMGVDSWSVLSPSGPGRDSVRLQSKRAYTHGLVIADFAHVPGSNCGSWPAFWMVGPDWPRQGELDIYEGVHLNTYNHVTLHTSPGCVPGVGAGGERGTRVGNADCGLDGGFVGCGVESHSATSYGSAFNAHGGGVYATLWTGSGIRVWYFAARDVPENIRSGNPDPNSWGTPMANYVGCDFDGKFRDMRLVFDITFCGDWAGGVWGSTSCAQANPSCNGYVASQPQSFADVSWALMALF